MSHTASRRLSAATLALLLGSVVGCTDDEASSPDAVPTPTAEPTPPPLETTATLGTVTGRLPKPERARVAADVAAVVDGWWDAAYVGGEYPRTDFSDAFPGFTDGAAREARVDRALMTNARLGAGIEGVTAKVRQVVVDVLAVEGTPQGATARFRLVFVTETGGTPAERVSVRGRLALTPAQAGWQVIAYDVARGIS